MLKSALVLCAGLTLLGCGGDIDSYCEEATDCEGGNDKDRDACEQRKNSDQDVADTYGCKDEWDKWFECEVDNATCQPGNNGSNYTSQLPDGTKTCGEHKNALDACIELASDVR